MHRIVWLLGLVAALAVVGVGEAADAVGKEKSPREALQAVHDLVGKWSGTGTPFGTREERDRGYWKETIDWKWQFKGQDAWLRADIDKGKHYTRFELRYLPKKDGYELKAWTAVGKQEQTFEGKLARKLLTVSRQDEKTKQGQRLVFSLLHSNRHLVTYETKAANHTVYTRVYQVGATLQGVPFASEDGKPECVVSGGLGTMAVMHKGKTYYVCCTGCRDEFKENPEKYIKEAEAKAKKP